MVNPENSFHTADYCIFGFTIVISLGIGLYYALSGGKQRTTSEYFVGNRKMTILPVAVSLMVSFESSIMMLGTPAETGNNLLNKLCMTVPLRDDRLVVKFCQLVNNRSGKGNKLHPTDPQKVLEMKTKFLGTVGFTNAIGCMDGVLFPVQTLYEDEASYVCSEILS